MDEFKGRSVVITGGSRGIGLGIASAFVEAGANVVITGRQESLLESAKESLGERASYVVARVGSAQDCVRMAEAVVERHGGIDVLCANAGVFPAARIEDMTLEGIAEVMSTNLYGTVFALQACLEELTRSGNGRVVVTSSITGPVTGYPGWSHYGASKAAQMGFIRTAALELAPRGITINAVLPGNIATEGLREMGAPYLDSMAASVPQGRLGSVADIGHAALFFASPAAGYITGQSLIVDGGQVLPESPQALADIGSAIGPVDCGNGRTNKSAEAGET